MKNLHPTVPAYGDFQVGQLYIVHNTSEPLHVDNLCSIYITQLPSHIDAEDGTVIDEYGEPERYINPHIHLSILNDNWDILITHEEIINTIGEEAIFLYRLTNDLDVILEPWAKHYELTYQPYVKGVSISIGTPANKYKQHNKTP